MIRLEMKNYNMILIATQLKYQLYHQAKFIKYHEYLTSEDILPSNQHQIIEQARFTNSPLGKAFEKQTKTIKDQGQKQVEALNTLKSNNQLTIKDVIHKNDKAKKELDKIKEIEKDVDREKLIYKTNECTCSFKNFQAIKTFGRDICDGKNRIEEANKYQTDLLPEIMNFRKNMKPRSQEKSKKKNLFLKTYIIFLRVEKKFLTLLK